MSAAVTPIDRDHEDRHKNLWTLTFEFYGRLWIASGWFAGTSTLGNQAAIKASLGNELGRRLAIEHRLPCKQLRTIAAKDGYLTLTFDRDRASSSIANAS